MDNIDILTSDLTTVDVSRPLLAAGVVELSVAEMKVEPNKDGSKQNLNITFKTVNNERSTKGDVLNPGMVIFHTISLTPTEKYTSDRIMQSLKMLRTAITGDKGGAFAPVDQYLGKTLSAKIFVDEDKNGVFPTQNRVKTFIAKE